jgi:hypothetical protein
MKIQEEVQLPDMESGKDSQRQPGDLKDIIPDESWTQWLLRKITPFGPAYPAWIAVILIGLILLFTLIIRIIVDYNLLGMK